MSALLLAELMAWHGKSLGELFAVLHAEFGQFHYGRVDLDVTSSQKKKAIEYFSDAKLTKLLNWPIARRENMDGIKLYLGDIGWVMIRASGTENLLRVYSETNDPAITQLVLQAVTKLVHDL